MQHRYGRHGSQAWFRLHKRRNKRFNRAIVHTERVTVIHVHLHIRDTERIFIVSFGELEEERAFVEGTLTESGNGSEPPRLSPGLFEDWQSNAKVEAYHKLRKDIKEFGEPSSDPALRAYATETGEVRLRDFPGIDRRGKSIFQLVSMYSEMFVTSYAEHLREGRESGAIADATTMAIQRKAREDRALLLNDLQFPIYGTMRAIEQLLKITIPSDYLSRIEQLAHAYQQAAIEKKEVPRISLDSSGPFPVN